MIAVGHIKKNSNGFRASKFINKKTSGIIPDVLISGRRGSNSQQPAWKAGTLPIELRPQSC